SSSDSDAIRPFIFQLPATSGRRAIAMILVPGRRGYQRACRRGRGRDTFPAVKSTCCGRPSRSLLYGSAVTPPPPGSSLWRPHPPTQHIDWSMLRGLRTASTGWLGKLVMAVVVGLLVIAFGIWGIGDIFRGGFTREAVATVGSSKISVEQFRQLYNNKLQMAGRQLRRAITPDEARSRGFDQQVLGQWMQEAALDQRARAMRLGISNAEVTRRITEDPSFQSRPGQFDSQQFQAILRELGYTEQGYVAEQRR